MELFNIGIGELLVILVLMYVVLGPQGMLRAARWLGQMTRQAYRFFNETWRSVTDVPMDLRDLPRALLDETGLKEPFDELRQDTRAVRAKLNEAAGSLNQTIRPPVNSAGARSNGPSAGQPPAEQAAAGASADNADNADNTGRYELKIRPVQGAVSAAGSQPAAGSQSEAPKYPAENPPDGPQQSVEEQSPAEPPRPKRGRPRKGEVRPPPPPREPRKRGRPPKNRPEATADEGPRPEPPPVKERPTDLGPQSRLPRRAPSQPGGAIAPLDLDQPQGARAYDSKPAPPAEDAGGDHPQETTHPDAA